MKSKKVLAICATAGVLFSGIALAAPAQADPVAESYAIVGSDTLEDVVGALIQGTSISGSPVRTLVNNASSGSFDATGTPYITTKTSGVRFGRPNGSGDGRTALLRSIDGANFQASAQLYPDTKNGGTTTFAQAPATSITGMVDLARASSGGTASASGVLVRVPFGRDAIGYVYDANAGATGVENLTAAELKTIFEGGTVTKTGFTIRAIFPQTGSGTGKDWAGMIGSTAAAVSASTSAGNFVGQEHDASTLASYTNTTNATVGNIPAMTTFIMPMSASRWIAMNQGGSYQKKTDSILMGSVAGTPAVTGDCTVAAITAATGHLCTTMAPNAAFYNAAVDGKTFGRDTYIVAESERILLNGELGMTSTSAKFDQNLRDMVDETKSTSLTNTSTSSASKAGSVKLKYGFLAPSTTTRVRISG